MGISIGRRPRRKRVQKNVAVECGWEKIFNFIPDTRLAIGRSAVHIRALDPSAAMRINLLALSTVQWHEMFANLYSLPVDSFSDYSIENNPENLPANVTIAKKEETKIEKKKNRLNEPLMLQPYSIYEVFFATRGAFD